MSEDLITKQKPPATDSDAAASQPLNLPPQPRRNMKFCSVCGAEIAKNAKVCPHCGAKNKKPLYKRVWFILLCVVFAIIVAVIVAALLEDPAEGKAFDPATNTTFSYGGIDFSVPNYYEKKDDDFTVFEPRFNAAYLQFKELAGNIPNFRTYKAKIAELAEDAGRDDGLALVGEPVYASVAQQPAWRCNMESDSHHAQVVAINHGAADKIIIIVFLQDKRAAYDYASDFELILDSAVSTAVAPNRSDAASGDVNPDFRATMDSYEAFFDEYIAFMQKYASDPGNAMSMLSDYMDFLNRYTEVMAAMESIDTSNLSSEDMAYYLEVTNRISQKLLKIAG